MTVVYRTPGRQLPCLLADTVTGDFELTMDELRVVASYVAGAAEPLLPLYEAAVPDDGRPRAALAAARRFIDGERRTILQRTASMDAHRAASAAPSEVARLAAQAAGDAAAAAYLHPIAKAHQVGHILRASANAVRIAELAPAGTSHSSERALAEAAASADAILRAVLLRYPTAPHGKSRVAVLMQELDALLRRSSPAP